MKASKSLYGPHNWLKLIFKPPLKLFGHWITAQNHCYAHLEGSSHTDHTDELRQRHLQDDRHSLAAVHSRPDQLVIAIFTQQPVHQTLLWVCTRSTCGRTQTHTCQITPASKTQRWWQTETLQDFHLNTQVTLEKGCFMVTLCKSWGEIMKINSAGLMVINV